MKSGLPPELAEMFRKEEEQRIKEQYEKWNKPTTTELKYRKERKRKNRLPKMNRKKNR